LLRTYWLLTIGSLIFLCSGAWNLRMNVCVTTICSYDCLITQYCSKICMYVLAREDRIYRGRPFRPKSWKKFTLPDTKANGICGGKGELTAGCEIVHCLYLFLLYTRDTTSPLSYFPSPPKNRGSVKFRENKLFSWRRPDIQGWAFAHFENERFSKSLIFRSFLLFRSFWKSERAIALFVALFEKSKERLLFLSLFLKEQKSNRSFDCSFKKRVKRAIAHLLFCKERRKERLLICSF